jgi:hypothetical protein
MDGVNNFMKKRISCRDNSLPKTLCFKNVVDFEKVKACYDGLFKMFQ